MIYPFIAGPCSDLPTVACCRVMKVSVSGFYEWQQRQSAPSARSLANAELTATICEIWRQSRGTYGSPRVWAELRLGRRITVSRKRVERLMRQAGIEGKSLSSEGDCGIAPDRTRKRPGPMIWSTAGSKLRDLTGCGWPTSPNIRPSRGRCIWQ